MANYIVAGKKLIAQFQKAKGKTPAKYLILSQDKQDWFGVLVKSIEGKNETTSLHWVELKIEEISDDDNPNNPFFKYPEVYEYLCELVSASVKAGKSAYTLEHIQSFFSAEVFNAIDFNDSKIIKDEIISNQFHAVCLQLGIAEESKAIRRLNQINPELLSEGLPPIDDTTPDLKTIEEVQEEPKKDNKPKK